MVELTSLELSVACLLLGAGVLAGLTNAIAGGAEVKRIVEHRDGFTVVFESSEELDEKIESWLAMEERCCPFFSCKITREAAPASLLLRISGPRVAKEILRGEFEARGLFARFPLLAASRG